MELKGDAVRVGGNKREVKEKCRFKVRCFGTGFVRAKLMLGLKEPSTARSATKKVIKSQKKVKILTFLTFVVI